MGYIKVPINIVMDYIPKDFNVCKNCLYEGICPWEWDCPTVVRIRDAKWKLKE